LRERDIRQILCLQVRSLSHYLYTFYFLPFISTLFPSHRIDTQRVAVASVVVSLIPLDISGIIPLLQVLFMSSFNHYIQYQSIYIYIW
jgi:hypothetical protein